MTLQWIPYWKFFFRQMNETMIGKTQARRSRFSHAPRPRCKRTEVPTAPSHFLKKPWRLWPSCMLDRISIACQPNVMQRIRTCAQTGYPETQKHVHMCARTRKCGHPGPSTMPSTNVGELMQASANAFVDKHVRLSGTRSEQVNRILFRVHCATSDQHRTLGHSVTVFLCPQGH